MPDLEMLMDMADARQAKRYSLRVRMNEAMRVQLAEVCERYDCSCSDLIRALIRREHKRVMGES